MSGVTSLELAKMIAKDHGLFIVDVRQREPKSWPPVYYTAYVVYRRPAMKDGRPVRLGRRKSGDDLLQFVKKLAGIEQVAPA